MQSILRDKTAIITGASSGIGRATALLMAQEQMKLALASRNADNLDAVRYEVQGKGAPVLACPTDVTNREQVDSLVRETEKLYGHVDIVVCNAGQILRRPAAELTIPEMRRVIEVNFFGTLNLIYAVLPRMLQRRSGHIVVVSSVDGKKGLPPEAAYVTSKFALVGFMDVLRQELHGTGVNASTILPGRVDTPMVESLRFPLGSRKIPSERVARSILRAIKKNRAEVIVPYLGPKFLVIANSLNPRLGDWLVRLFRLWGEEEGSGISHINPVV